MTTEFDPRISLAIADGHNIRPPVERLLRRSGVEFELKKNGNIHAEVQDPYLRSITVNNSKDITPLLMGGFYQFVIYGRDWLREAQAGGMKIEEVLALGVSVCQVVVEVPEYSNYRHPKDLEGTRIATLYPNLTKHFFQRYNTKVTTVEYHSKEEGAPAAGVADAVVATYVTGWAAKQNKLRLLEEEGVIIERSEAVLATPTAFLDERGSDLIVVQFIDRFKQAVDYPARRRVYQPFPGDGTTDARSFLSNSVASIAV